MAIKSFANKATEDIGKPVSSKKALKILNKNLHKIAYRRLIFLDNMASLQDLREWRSLHLEKLKGKRNGQFSIRINDQYRVCFKWINNNAYEVEIVDYH